jgi:hypothetical protein
LPSLPRRLCWSSVLRSWSLYMAWEIITMQL